MGFIDWDVLPLSRTEIDRDAEQRTAPDVLERTLADPLTQVLLVHRGRLAVSARPADGTSAADTPADDIPADEATAGRSAPALALLSAADVDPALAPRESHRHDARCLWLYLGRGFLALVLDKDVDAAGLDIEGVAPRDPAGDLVSGNEWASLRDVGSELSARDAGLATGAVALAAWHAAHPRCPRCGEPTEPIDGGWVRRCTNDGSHHYPRTDAAVIMAVVDADDRLLLGHAAQWPEGRFSTLAGYVEPGESIENAVRREVLEEVGVVVGAVEYRGSQPWPFPASLMLGFVAHATSTDVRPDGSEVTDARWFSREELVAAIDAGTVLLPSGTSIARALIEDWFGGPLAGSWSRPAGAST